MLTVAYNRFNKLYFASKLPPSPLIRVQHFRGENADNLAVTDGQRIWFNSKIKNWTNTLLLTLLHEMAHIKVGNEPEMHGPKFQKEMRRLARAGAFDKYW